MKELFLECAEAKFNSAVYAITNMRQDLIDWPEVDRQVVIKNNIYQARRELDRAINYLILHVNLNSWEFE